MLHRLGGTWTGPGPGESSSLVPVMPGPGSQVILWLRLEHDAQGEIVTLMNIFADFRVYKECRFSFGGTQ